MCAFSVVTSSYFRLPNKDGGHAILSVVGENHGYRRQVTGDEIFTLHGTGFTHASTA